jgi:hypothetical protein
MCRQWTTLMRCALRVRPTRCSAVVIGQVATAPLQCPPDSTPGRWRFVIKAHMKKISLSCPNLQARRLCRHLPRGLPSAYSLSWIRVGIDVRAQLVVIDRRAHDIVPGSRTLYSRCAPASRSHGDDDEEQTAACMVTHIVCRTHSVWVELSLLGTACAADLLSFTQSKKLPTLSEPWTHLAVT